MSKTVQIGRFSTRLDADLARLRLEAEGIRHAKVIEHLSFYPTVNDTTGGVRIQVLEEDEQRATALLDDSLPEDPNHVGTYREASLIPDDEPKDVLRCPRCEHEFCFFGRPRMFETTNALGKLGPAFILLLPLAPFVVVARGLGAKRWRCDKCGHAWDDVTESRFELTPSDPADPRPVFRLARGHAGVGALIGLLVGFVGSLLLAFDHPILALFAGIVIGWVAGSFVRYDVCSQPTCRKRLKPGDEICEACKGHIAGSITVAREHYAEAAAFRRELARAVVEPRVKRRRSKPRRLPAVSR